MMTKLIPLLPKAKSAQPPFDARFLLSLSLFIIFFCITSYAAAEKSAEKTSQVALTQEEQAWLKERGAVGRLFKAIGESMASGDVSLRRTWHETDMFGSTAARKEREREEDQLREALEREAIDEDEAKWLIGRIRLDGVMQPNEKALLEFLKNNAPSVPPSLAELFEKARI